MRNKTIALLVAGMLLSGPALAGAQSENSPDRAATIAALEHRADVLRKQPAGSKLGGMQRQRITQQRAAIRGLIERLEAGQTVDPNELDRALGRASHRERTPREALEHRADLLRHQTVGRKLGAMERQRIARERAEIRRLIERLEAGQTVDPSELDQPPSQ